VRHTLQTHTSEDTDSSLSLNGGFTAMIYNLFLYSLSNSLFYTLTTAFAAVAALAFSPSPLKC
jgi:hypothetical protein